MTDEQIEELARNVCNELAIEQDKEVLVILTTALKQARDAGKP